MLGKDHMFDSKNLGGVARNTVGKSPSVSFKTPGFGGYETSVKCPYGHSKYSVKSVNLDVFLNLVFSLAAILPRYHATTICFNAQLRNLSSLVHNQSNLGQFDMNC